ncbi:MAG: hypothetical protein M3124_05650 [Actinomycetota bacterium]|nr:hypothetical protein [Actinomycetota bacterium]
MRLFGSKRSNLSDEGAGARATLSLDQPPSEIRLDDSPGSSTDSSDERVEPTLWLSTMESLAAIVAPVTFLSALAYYFGWTRTNTLVGYFGIDHSVLGLSTQDYILRSVDALFVPLGAGLLMAFLVTLVHGALVRRLRRKESAKGLLFAADASLLIGALLLLVGIDSLFGLTTLPVHFLLGALSPGLGAVLIAYGLFIRSRLVTKDVAGPHSKRRPNRVAALGALSALVALSLFWAASEYARELGESRGVRLAANLDLLSDAVVYSHQQLHIDAPGTTEDAIGNDKSSFRYRTRGLKLFIKSDDKYFLLSDGWTRTQGTAIVLPDTPDIRIELAPGDR